MTEAEKVGVLKSGECDMIEDVLRLSDDQIARTSRPISASASASRLAIEKSSSPIRALSACNDRPPDGTARLGLKNLAEGNHCPLRRHGRCTGGSNRDPRHDRSIVHENCIWQKPPGADSESTHPRAHLPVTDTRQVSSQNVCTLIIAHGSE